MVFGTKIRLLIANRFFYIVANDVKAIPNPNSMNCTNYILLRCHHINYVIMIPINNYYIFSHHSQVNIAVDEQSNDDNQTLFDNMITSADVFK